MSELVWSLCEILFVNTLPGQFYIGLESVRDPLRQHSPRSVLYWSGVCARSSSSTLSQVSSILVWSLCEILFVNTLPGQFYIGLESVRDPLRQHSPRSVLYWSGVCARSSSSTLSQVSAILVWSLCEILFVNTLPGQFYIGLESVRDPLRQHSPRSVLYWSGVCARSSSSTLSQVSSILVWSLCEILFVNTLPGQFYIGLESVRDPLRQHSPRSVLYWSGVCARSSSSTLSQVSSILVWSLCEILFVNTLPGQFYIGLESVRDPLRQHSPRSVLYWSGVCARSSSSTLSQVSSILVWSLCEILFVNTLPGQFYIGLESVRDPLRQHSPRSVLYWSGVCARSSSSTLSQVSSILVWSLCEILFVNTLPGQFYIGLESVRDPLRQHSPRSVLYWSGVCARSSSSTLSQVSSILVWSLCEILFVNTLPGQFYIGLESVRDPLRQHSPRSVLYWSGVCARSSSSTLSQVSSILVWSLCEILFVNTLPGQCYIGLESV